MPSMTRLTLVYLAEKKITAKREKINIIIMSKILDHRESQEKYYSSCDDMT